MKTGRGTQRAIEGGVEEVDAKDSRPGRRGIEYLPRLHEQGVDGDNEEQEDGRHAALFHRREILSRYCAHRVTAGSVQDVFYNRGPICNPVRKIESEESEMMNCNTLAAAAGGIQQSDTMAASDGLTGFLEQQQTMNGALRLDQVTIVLVEDDTDSRESLTLLLEAEGAQVVAVADAEEGVEAALRLLPDAVVCDLDLPAMDGFYLIQRLRDHEIRGDHAPSVAVALTGHTDDAYRLRSIGEGFQHFMTKPALPEELVTLLRDAIDARGAA